MSEPDAGFEILEHTADVGVRSWGPSLECAFEQATRGLLDIVGVWQPGRGERRDIAVEARDLGGLLVDWLDEVLYLQDTLDVVVTGLQVREITPTSARGWIEITERRGEVAGTAVKAITYHQLAVERVGDRWETTVYLDI